MSQYNDTVDCPECGDEGAFFNGVTYECPNCGYEWDDDVETEMDDDSNILDGSFTIQP